MKVLKVLWTAISGIALMALVVVTGLVFMYFTAVSVYAVLGNFNTITDMQLLSLIGWCVLVFQPYNGMLVILKYVSRKYREERELRELNELVNVGIEGAFK